MGGVWGVGLVGSVVSWAGVDGPIYSTLIGSHTRRATPLMGR